MLRQTSSALDIFKGPKFVNMPKMNKKAKTLARKYSRKLESSQLAKLRNLERVKRAASEGGNDQSFTAGGFGYSADTFTEVQKQAHQRQSRELRRLESEDSKEK